jgi:hypothetical protein
VVVVDSEAAFFLEWLAHHRAVGISEVLAVSCEGQHGTGALLDRLQDLGWLTHLRLPAGDEPDRVRAGLKLARRHEQLQDAEGISTLDPGECVNVRGGDHSGHALLEALPQATAITLTRRGFGNNSVVRFKDAPITQTFTKTAPDILYWPWRAALFKTLYRNDGTYTKLGVHRPRGLQPEKQADAQWYDGHGRPLGEQFVTKRTFSDYGRANHGLVQLNHYPLGAMESFILKVADWDKPTVRGMDYWVEHNFNTVTDETIRDTAPQSETLRAQMLEDAKLARLHDKAVAIRKARFMTLMEQEEYRDLFARLLITPGSRPVSLEGAKSLSGFANLGQLRAR